MALITAAQSRTLLELARNDKMPEVDSDLFFDWLNSINRFLYAWQYKLDPQAYITEETINVVADTSDYPLPADYGNVKLEGTGIFKTDSDGLITTDELEDTNRGSLVTGKYVKGLSGAKILVLTPMPSATDTLIAAYIPIIDELTSDTDKTVVDNRFKRLLQIALNVRYEIWDEDKDDEVWEDARFKRELMRLQADFSSELDIYTA